MMDRAKVPTTFVEESRALCDAMDGRLDMLSVEPQYEGSEYYLEQLRDMSVAELETRAEYVNIGVVPNAPVSWPPATFPSIGPIQDARFSKAFAEHKGSQWNAYLYSLYGESLAPPKGVDVHAVGVAAQYILHERQYKQDKEAFESSENTLYQNTLSSGLALRVQTAMEFIRTADPDNTPLFFESDLNVPAIVECAGSVIVDIANSVSALTGKITNPMERMTVFVGILRKQVASINATLDAAQRGSYE